MTCVTSAVYSTVFFENLTFLVLDFLQRGQKKTGADGRFEGSSYVLCVLGKCLL